MKKVQIDNSEFYTKIKLREKIVQDGNKILDCFHGNGKMWNYISKNKKIDILGIEKDKKKGHAIHGDNIKFLKTMDLSLFNIIDLDSYGIPFEQIETIIKNKTLSNVVIFYTFIQTAMGSVDKKLLLDYGITEQMYSKTKTIYRNHGFNAFLNYLNKKSVDNVYDCFIKLNSSYKHYGYFEIKKAE